MFIIIFFRLSRGLRDSLLALCSVKGKAYAIVNRFRALALLALGLVLEDKEVQSAPS